MQTQETRLETNSNRNPVAIAHWRIRTPDDVMLTATHFEPHDPVGTLLVLPGIGIPQRFYRHFARWMADQGTRVITMDYRGVGESKLPPGAGASTTLAVWGAVDAAAVYRAVEGRFGAPVVLGHSFGGQAVGLADDFQRARALVMVASQSADWRLWSGTRQWLTAAYWYAGFPIASALWDVVPGWATVGVDLPAGVIRQWAAWGRRPGWLPSVRPETFARYAGFDVPVQAFRFTDDVLAPEDAVEGLLEHFTGTEVERLVVSPLDLGVAKIGHLGFFRRGVGSKLWPFVLASVKRSAASLRLERSTG